MLDDYVDGMGAANAKGLASGAVTILWVGGLAYVTYKILNKPAARRSKSAAGKRKSGRKRAKSGKRGSRAARRARAVTKRLYFDRRDQTMKQRASDWVAEQERKQRKSLRYATA